MKYYNNKDNNVMGLEANQDIPKGYTLMSASAFEAFRNPPKTLEEITESRYSRLDNIFNDKALGLKKLAIDKPHMEDIEAINNQYRVYEEMYKNAKNGLYNTETNTAIITANESVKVALAPLTLLINSIKNVLDLHITSNTSNIDDLLNMADEVSLGLSDLTPTKLQELKTSFGL